MKRAFYSIFPLVTAILIALPFHDARAEEKNDFVMSLTEENIVTFLEEVRTMAIGKNDYFSDGEITAYFKKHLAHKGQFRSKTLYEIPGYPPSETELKVGKKEYIEQVLQGQGTIHDFETSIEIKEIKIAGTGKSATLTTTSIEKGKMPWPDGQGSDGLVSIEGRSDCKQKIIISLSHYIQMASAECDTTISFMPFGDTPLGE